MERVENRIKNTSTENIFFRVLAHLSIKTFKPKFRMNHLFLQIEDEMN